MLNFLFNNIKCPHNKIYPFSDGTFCPDCGQEIKISWRLLRCECCSTKRKALFFLNKLVPEEKFCKKCGSPEYYIDTREKIEFFDYEYAIILKEEVETDSKIRKILQVWVEEENMREVFRKPKLLTVFNI